MYEYPDELEDANKEYEMDLCAIVCSWHIKKQVLFGGSLLAFGVIASLSQS